MFISKDEGGKLSYLKDRPILMLTSTSYTPDEDLSIIVEALTKYADRKDMPKIHLVVTGAGP